MSKVEFDEYGDRLPLTPEDVSEFLETFGIDFKKTGSTSPMVASLLKLLTDGQQFLDPSPRPEDGSVFSTHRGKWVQAFVSPIIDGFSDGTVHSIRITSNSASGSEYSSFIIPQSGLTEVEIFSTGEILAVAGRGQASVCTQADEMLLHGVIEGISQRVTQRLVRDTG